MKGESKVAPFETLERIFSRVSQVPRDDQETLLEEICTDVEIRRQVRDLLSADSSQGQFLDQSLYTHPTDLQPGTSIGPFTLLEVIGEGGMGVVYMAEQTEPIRREVAIKVVKPGADTKQVLARFDAERHALSMMEHPNIAKVLDAGSTPAGRPFFVMELVRGVSITKYCRERGLSPREMLAIFVAVCNAVQHAHQKGVIHRDLKPSNILIAEYDGLPVAKVIDFGVAKAINQPLTDLTMSTGVGQIVGTFEYMSPEQSLVNQLDVDTRTDIYGLGVLLYELLTGSTPFNKHRMRKVDWEEMLRIIREEDPPVPSTRLSETARNNAAQSETIATDMVKISRIVRGEVDWIVMKALEKDRERRYVSAQALAEDIQNFLRGDPVAACPPTRAYLLRKFAKRHQVTLVTASLILVALVIGLIGTAWQARRATLAEAKARAKQDFAERQQARAESSEKQALMAAERATRISRYLRNDLLGLEGNSTFFNPEVKFDPDLKLITLLERAQKQLETRFSERPGEKLQMQSMLVQSYCSIGRYDVASDLLGSLIEQASARFGPTHDSVIEGTKILVTLELQQGHWALAGMHLEELIDLKQQVLGSEHIEFGDLNNLATTQRVLGNYIQAERLYAQLYDLCVRWKGPASTEALEARSKLAVVKGKLGQDQVAEKWLRQVLASRRNERLDSKRLDNSLQELGEFHLARQHYDQAEPLLAEALELRQQTLDTGSPHTIATRFCLATVGLAQNELDEAEQVRDEFIEYVMQNTILPHANMVELIELHADLLMQRENFTDAERLLRLAKKSVQVLGQESGALAGRLRSALGESLAGQGKWDEAENELLAGHRILAAVESTNREQVQAWLDRANKRLSNYYSKRSGRAEASKWTEQLRSQR